MSIIMYGQPVVDKILDECFDGAKYKLKFNEVAIFTNENDQASKVYVKNKKKKFEQIGVKCNIFSTNNMSLWDIHQKTEQLKKENIPYMFQLPFSDKNLEKFIEHIPKNLDIDSMSTHLLGDFYHQPTYKNIPCTPLGIYFMLKHYIPEEKLLNKNVVVIGRSAIVGRPMARVMEYFFNSTVTVCHSKTKDIAFYTKNADIVIVAVGRPNFLTGDMVKDGVILVDVGINRDENGKLCGDIYLKDCQDKAYAISPVPKGVGVTTVGSLVFKCCKKNNI